MVHASGGGFDHLEDCPWLEIVAGDERGGGVDAWGHRWGGGRRDEGIKFRCAGSRVPYHPAAENSDSVKEKVCARTCSGASADLARPEGCPLLPQVRKLDEEVLQAALGAGGVADAVVVAEVELVASAAQADRFAAAAEAACAEEAEIVRAALVRTSAATSVAHQCCCAACM